MTQLILGSMLVGLIPLALIFTFNKLDKEFKDKLKIRKLDIVIIIAVAIIYGILYSRLGLTLGVFVNTTLLTAYLVFMSYTDQKTMLLYSSISFIMIIYEIIMIVVNYNIIPFNEYTYTVLIILVVLGIMSIFRWIGLGDVYIYIVLALYYTQYRNLPTLTLMVNILLTNILFIVITVILKIIRKDKEKHQPLTIFIAISTFICNLFLI